MADRVHPHLKLALVAAEGTGRRISAWRNLQWDDVDFAAGVINWRAEHDKKGYEQVVPMSDAVKAGLLRGSAGAEEHRERAGLPRPEEPGRALRPHVLDNSLRRAFARAGVELPKGGLWHTRRCRDDPPDRAAADRAGCLEFTICID